MDVIYNSFVNYFQIFLVVLVRMIGLFITAPFFSGQAIPMRFKLALGFFTSLIAVPLVIGMGYKGPYDLLDLGIQIIVSFVFGAGVGIFIFIIVSAFQISAQIFSIQMGLGMNEIFDPISDTQVPAIGNIFGIIILLLLIRADAHFFMMQLMVDSFKNVQSFTLPSIGVMMKGFISAVMTMFDIGLKISLPIIGVTILLDLAMSIIARVAPQFNVMIMGFNLKLIVGFLIVWLLVPSLVDLGGNVIYNVIKDAGDLIRYFKTV
jgi:flagellar biosynthetic protein FliR